MTNSDTAPRLYQVYLTALDGNGHLDLFVVGLGNYRVWQGLGNGRFTADPPAVYRENVRE